METKKTDPPKEWKFLKLNPRALEYVRMLDNYDAGKFIKIALLEEFWERNEELEDMINNWSKELKMVVMMWNEHLFEN